jgi:poly(A) polymerase/tRNA nucleotidyltransferase (CCA-adding enzyme)
VLDHLLLACDLAPAGDLVVRLAALLHDVGKPDVRVEDGSGGYTFHRHEARSAEIALAVLDRLRFPKKTAEEVAHLVREHMFHYEDRWTDAAVRRFLVRVGPESLDRLLSLRLADTGAISGVPAGPETLLRLGSASTPSSPNARPFPSPTSPSTGTTSPRSVYRAAPNWA